MLCEEVNCQESTTLLIVALFKINYKVEILEEAGLSKNRVRCDISWLVVHLSNS